MFCDEPFLIVFQRLFSHPPFFFLGLSLRYGSSPLPPLQRIFKETALARYSHSPMSSAPPCTLKEKTLDAFPSPPQWDSEPSLPISPISVASRGLHYSVRLDTSHFFVCRISLSAAPHQTLMNLALRYRCQVSSRLAYSFRLPELSRLTKDLTSLFSAYPRLFYL